ncbi:MAG: PorT family protein [Bacteroidales bacterium]|nr:PorT family protein [Bacteroidales bacterium]
MRKITLLFPVLMLLISSSSLNGQIISYGAKLGMSFPGFINEKIASQRITLALSLTGSVRITRSVKFQIDPGFQRKGNKYTYQVWDSHDNIIEDSSYLVKTNMDYLTFPAFFKIHIGGANTFYLQAGGYYGYLIHANFTGKRAGEMVKRYLIKPGLALHDFGLLAGGGIETPIRQGLSVLLDIKYQYGLKDLNLNPEITGFNQPLKNKGLVMSMGIIMDIE